MIYSEMGVDQTENEDKSFEWVLENFDEKGLSVYLKFEKPEMISYPFIDYCHVQFNNTGGYMRPQDGDKRPIPDGYTVVIELPSQIRRELADPIAG